MLKGIDPKVYELLNLAIMTLCVFVVAIFVRYLAAENRAGRFELLAWRPLRGRMRHQLAVAIIVATGGEAALRAWTWGIRFFDRIGWIDVARATAFPYAPIPIAAAILQCVGLVCFIRVLTPDEWARWTWLACLGAVMALVFATGVLHPA